jgi:hypothetical protein
MFKGALTRGLSPSLVKRMGAKDWLVERAGMAMLNQAVLKPYGTMTSLKLDTTARTIEAELDLKGETQPVRLHVREYELRDEGGKTFIVFKDIQTSREWLTKLASDFVVARPFEIPEHVRRFLPMIA